jgi:hypothetical protein
VVPPAASPRVAKTPTCRSPRVEAPQSRNVVRALCGLGPGGNSSAPAICAPVTARRQTLTMLGQPLRMPVAGRSAAGVAPFTLAIPLCRLAGLTTNPRTARTVGLVLAVSDFAGVLSVVGSSTSDGQRRAARINALADVLLATALLLLGLRRQSRERSVALVLSASVWFGAGAWLMGARKLEV